ncbi:hypothetical protein KPSB59_2240013 [Klebsiella quasipneumoniae subsp. quasipneumoniae]|nr:hypothetical protein KPSB59_2240013 [Klebsiella quasipneumoniae subsp. quasipneumoniae]CDQ14970.1 hypothetical protein KQQSB11_300118 [Klebsiella quasipneumoniae subsp. quasipneumoniae]
MTRKAKYSTDKYVIWIYTKSH